MRYIGSKINLLDEIEKVVDKNLKGTEVVFADLFAGTNTVGRHFKSRFQVISNDLLYFSYLNGKATIENNRPLRFYGLTQLGISAPLNYLQNGAEAAAKGDSVGYYEESYSPTGGAMYVTVENAKRIDWIRETIEEWWKKGLLSPEENAYLISALIEAVPFVSNITGTYGAFLKKWDDRALKPLDLKPIQILDNGKSNKSFNIDANILAPKLEADIVYIDTPYNGRQYPANYHVLENIARHNKPSLRGTTKIFDWQPLKSQYSSKKDALNAMDALIGDLKAPHIVVSYNSEGIISEDDLENLMRSHDKNGQVQVSRIPYRKYKSKISKGNGGLHELIYYISKDHASENSSKVSAKTVHNLWAAEKDRFIKSPLNYIGGKYRLLKQILPLFPERIDTFVDLFSGGANVGINVQARKYIFNDMNHLINEMFRHMANCDADKLVCEIKSKIERYGLSKTDEAAFKRFRAAYNEHPNPIDLYVLSSFSYNYQFRFNNDLKYNNPFGKNRSHFSSRMEYNLRRFVERIQNLDIEFVDGYFEDFDFSILDSDDFVYLDPPYLLTTGSYNDGNRGFRNWTTHQELAMYEVLRRLETRGIPFALSNVIEHKGTEHSLLLEFVEELKLNVHYLDHSYGNSSYNVKSRSGSKEVLVTNYN